MDEGGRDGVSGRLAIQLALLLVPTVVRHQTCQCAKALKIIRKLEK